jgi:TolA-binding protein
MTATTDDRLADIEARLAELEAENEQLQEQNDQLENRVYTLEAENQELREQNDELTERVDDLEAENDRLREAVDKLPEINMDGEDLSTFQVNGLPVGRKVSASVTDHSLEAELEALKDDLEASNPTPSGGETTGQRHETPLEQVVAMPEHIADDQLTANQERARFVASSMDDYATKVGSGDYRLTAADLRSVLRAAYDTSHSETVDRVRTILADLGGDEIELQEPRTAGFKRTDEKQQRGKQLLVSASLVRRLRGIDHDVVTSAEA